ncbi:MAG: 30S ribosomal protein S8e [Candidatus Hodarchaeales archaeon]
MVQYHGPSKTKKSGSAGRLHPSKKKQKYRMGRFPVSTIMGETRRRKQRTRGGNFKFKLFRADICNVTNTKNGKTVKSKILDVKGNPADRNFARRKIMTKGAIIQTELGSARISSRPGQTGTINAVLIPPE